MSTIKPSQLATLLAQTIPAKLPILITGAPGIGKSDSVEQACKSAGADCIVMHPVVSDPTDFKGLPWVTEGKAHFLPFGELNQLINADKLTACFLDDLGQASPSVQAAVMQLILARRVNGHKVSDNVVFLAATNSRAHRAGVSGILEPVKSRFASIVELVADINDWSAWACANGVAPELVAFIRFRPELLSNFQPTADMTNSPSPRTWASLSKLVALNLPSELQLPAYAGAVGEAAAVEFTSFMRVWKQMVNPDVVLATPDTAPIPDEPSAMYAISLAIAARVANGSMGRYCRYLERLVAAGKAEFAAVSLKAAIARDMTLCNSPGYITAMSGQLGKIITGSNS